MAHHSLFPSNNIVLTKLDFLVRYWELSARHAQMGEPLDAEERKELLGLMQLVGDCELPPPMSIERPHDAHPAQLIGEGSIRAVELRALTATALFVTSAVACSPGASVILRAVDAIAGVEYSVPCRVAWVAPGSPFSVALIVDGEPTRALFDDAPVLRSSWEHGATLTARSEALSG
jgi:hypothetical protein